MSRLHAVAAATILTTGAILGGCSSSGTTPPAPTVSYFIPVTTTQFAGTEQNKFHVYVTNGGGTVHPIVLDTGSQLTVVPKQYVGPGAQPVVPTQCHSISYGDGTTWCGRFYTGPMLLGLPASGVTGQGTYPSTVSSFPFLVADPSDTACAAVLTGCDKMPSDLTNRGILGVGFGQGAYGTTYNALLQLQEVAAGTMAPGYVVQLGHTLPGVTVGLTADNSAGFQTIQLSPSTSSVGQWDPNSFTGCVTLSNGPTQVFSECANVLFDTGTVDFTLKTTAADKPAAVMGFDPQDPYINAGTTISVSMPGTSPAVSYTYGATPTTTWASTQSSGFWESRAAGTFFLIGQFVFMGHDYLFDPTAGRIGFKALPVPLAPQIVPWNVLGPGGSAIVADRTPISMTTPVAGADIYFTTDGSTPSPSNGTRYTTPLPISAGATVKAVAVSAGRTSDVASVTYSVYASPYDITPIFTEANLGTDFPQRDAIMPTSLALSDWYNPGASYYTQHPGERTWGPMMDVAFPAVTVPPPAAQTLTWQRQRILYSARRHINTQYQHHHLLEWDPPQGWPFYPISLGHQSAGIDCSSFTAWNYNYALGITMTEDVEDQAALTSVTGPAGRTIPIEKIQPGATFGDTVASFRMGDLLYIKGGGSSTTVTHAITWIGQVNGAGDYLIIDSRDQLETYDSNHAMVPTGIQIRPFTPTSWYYLSLSHANRILK